MALRSLQLGRQPLLQLMRFGVSSRSSAAAESTAAAGPAALSKLDCRFASSATVKTAEPLYGGQTLQQIRARVFGEHIGNGLPSGRKLLRKKLMGANIASYYGNQDLERSDPFLEDQKAAQKKAKLDRLARRGKGPPKKGEGKRSKKRK